MPKKKSLKTLKAKADKLVSLAIRLRDCPDGWGQCITCGKNLPLEKLHAGHFMSRRYSATRYDSENINAQCAGCNTFRHGEQYRYGQELDLKYGEGTAQKLNDKAHTLHKLTIDELEQIIHDAQEEIKWYRSQ